MATPSSTNPLPRNNTGTPLSSTGSTGFLRNSVLSDSGDGVSEVSESAKREQAAILKNKDRWSRRVEFFLALFGLAIGYGNLWRFPYVAFEQGGGAILVPYVIFLIFVGIPMLTLELGVGQYLGMGPALCYSHVCPFFGGVGYAAIVTNWFTSVYFNVILAWSIHYTLASMDQDVPWRTCDNFWNRPGCIGPCEGSDVDLLNQNGTCMTRMEFCKAEYGETFVPGSAANICLGFDGLNRTFSTTIPAVDYQDRKVLGIYEMDDTFHTFTSYGSVMNRIFVCLFLAWLVSTVCVLKNINFAGKIVYVTCWLPILIAVVLLFRVLGLTGKENGMQAYVAPEYKYMYDGMVWFRAGATMMFSLGLGFGILPNLAAYNPFHGNFIRDAVGLSVLNSAYSVLIGFVAFSILGHLANVTGKELFSVVDSGVSLAFICYSSALARFTAVVRPLLSTVFFASLIFFGLSTQFSMFEAVLVAIMDVYPSLESHRKLLTLGLGFLGFLMGVPMTFQGGAHMLKLLDLYVPTTPVMVILLCQAIMFVHVYGWQNLMKDWNLMLGPPSKFEKLFRMYVFLSLAFVAPVMITGVLIYTTATRERTRYGKYVFPPAMDTLGWFTSLFCILPIPLVAMKTIFECKRNNQPWRSMFTPTSEWMPSYERENRNSGQEGSNRASFLSALSLNP